MGRGTGRRQGDGDGVICGRRGSGRDPGGPVAGRGGGGGGEGLERVRRERYLEDGRICHHLRNEAAKQQTGLLTKTTQSQDRTGQDDTTCNMCLTAIDRLANLLGSTAICATAIAHCFF